MDCNTGEIIVVGGDMADEVVKMLRRETSRQVYIADDRHSNVINDMKLLPPTDSEYKEFLPMPKRARKNNMRNRPCICGSGAKFKRCCWNKYT